MTSGNCLFILQKKRSNYTTCNTFWYPWSPILSLGLILRKKYISGNPDWSGLTLFTKLDISLKVSELARFSK